jgi:hypothetical protein
MTPEESLNRFLLSPHSARVFGDEYFMSVVSLVLIRETELEMVELMLIYDWTKILLRKLHSGIIAPLLKKWSGEINFM